MRKSGLRVLTLSLGLLALCSGSPVDSAPPPIRNAPNPHLSGKIELSCQRYLPLEPVDIVLTITNNGDTDYTFVCTDWWAQTRLVGQPWEKPILIPREEDSMLLNPFRFSGLYSAIDFLPVAPHQSKRFYYQGMNLSYWLSSPGRYQMRLLFRDSSQAANGQAVIEEPREASSQPFAFEVGALSREDELARSYLQEHHLWGYLGIPESFSRVPLPQLQPEFEEFLRQFPRSSYAPWVRLVLLSMPYFQVQSEMRRVQSLIREIQTERYTSAEPGKKPAKISDGEVFQRVLDERAKWEKQFGARVVEAFLEGQGKGLLPSQKQTLQDLEAQLATLAPTLPAPIDGYAWLAAIKVAASLGHTEARNRYLDKAVASSGETNLPTELRFWKEIIASGWQPTTP